MLMQMPNCHALILSFDSNSICAESVRCVLEPDISKDLSTGPCQTGLQTILQLRIKARHYLHSNARRAQLILTS